MSPIDREKIKSLDIRTVLPKEQAVRELKNIIATVESLSDNVARLRVENQELKSENYKDEELARLKESLNSKDELIGKLYGRTFVIDDDEQKKIDEFKAKHNHGSAGAIGGQYSYTFTPTSIGTIGTITCSCGESFDFSNLF